MAKADLPQDAIPLTPAVFHILLTLTRGERHGYAIKQEVERFTDGALRLGPGTLYWSIKRMVEDGLIEESDERPDPEFDDERRRYYRLTDWGLRVSRAEASRLAQVVSVARDRGLLESLTPSRAEEA